jgi:hypothetical protein
VGKYVKLHRTNKYMKLFRRLQNSTVLNAQILYRENTGKEIEQLSYRFQLAEGLFVKCGCVDEHKVPGRHSSDNTVPRLVERRFVRRIPPTGKKCEPQRRCAVCSKHGGRRDTVYWCENCDVGICFDCFEDYHTKLKF